VKVGDLVKDSGLGIMGVVLAIDVNFTKTTFGWVKTRHLEVISESR
jgi:heat shock protein HspQ